MNDNEVVNEIKPYLPLKIQDIQWDGTTLNMYDFNWNFSTMSAWRLKKNNQLICGCYDKDSQELIKKLKGLQIIDFIFTDNTLIDPVFIFLNDLRLEIFSTDTYEPWVLYIDKLGSFTASFGEGLSQTF